MDDYEYAERRTRTKYGQEVSVDYKSASMLKFGKHETLGTSSETIQNMTGNETFATSNAIDKISSSDGDDTSVVTVVGLTVSGTGTDAEFTDVTQTVTLAGQTETALTTALARVTRVYHTSGDALVGDIYVYEDDDVTAGVPDTAAKIHLKMLAGEQQSYKCSTTNNSDTYAFLTRMDCSVDKKTTAVVDFQLEVREVGGVFRPKVVLTGSKAATCQTHVRFEPWYIIPPNADFRIVGVASTTNVGVDASMQAVLARVKPDGT